MRRHITPGTLVGTVRVRRDKHGPFEPSRECVALRATEEEQRLVWRYAYRLGNVHTMQRAKELAREEKLPLQVVAEGERCE